MKYARDSIAHKQELCMWWWWCQEIFCHNSEQTGCSWWEVLGGVYCYYTTHKMTFKLSSCMWHAWGLIAQTSCELLVFYITNGRNVEGQRRFLCCILYSTTNFICLINSSKITKLLPGTIWVGHLWNPCYHKVQCRTQPTSAFTYKVKTLFICFFFFPCYPSFSST